MAERIKVVHLNTWDIGGAANAAIRICRAQRKRGIDASFLSLFNKATIGDDLNSYQAFLEQKYGRLGQKAAFFANKIYNQLPVKFDSKVFFNRPESLFQVHKHPLVQAADIIHLHSVVKFVDIPSFFREIKKPIVWTLHDMNPCSGGKHYDTMMYDHLTGLEAKYIQIKKKAYQNHQLHLVAPSQWLTDISAKSALGASFPNTNIPNCIVDNTFRRVERPVNKIPKILFAAQSIDDPRKGFKYLLGALKYIDKNAEIIIMGNVGSKEQFSSYPNFRFLGFVSGQEALSKAYSEADIFVIPSLEDNLPNTIVESQMCGTPVVGFKTGGIANMITDGVNGILVETFDEKALADGINKALKMVKEQTFSTEKIANMNRAYYSEESVVAKYNAVYQNLLS